MAGIEVGLIFALRNGISRGITWPRILMAVLAALFLALGVLRHYWDIYIHRTVRGISFIFCAVDALGDLTSLIAVLFQPHLDILGMVIYGVELVLWFGVFACGGYFNLRPWLNQKMHSKASDQDDRNASHDPNDGTNTEVARTGGLVLHNLSSSTSAFRTSSVSVDTVGSRMRRPSSQSIDN